MAISSKSTAKKTATPAKTPAKPAAKPTTAAKPIAAATNKPAVPAAKAAAKPKTAPTKKATVPSGQRRNYVEVAAYYIAERHGFTRGRELADWAAAEAEIDRLLAAGLLNP